MFGNKAATVTQYVASLPPEGQKVVRTLRACGKKLDMGKACVRFKSLEDLPLDVVGDVIAGTPMDAYIARYRQARTKTAKGK